MIEEFVRIPNDGHGQRHNGGPQHKGRHAVERTAGNAKNVKAASVVVAWFEWLLVVVVVGTAIVVVAIVVIVVVGVVIVIITGPLPDAARGSPTGQWRIGRYHEHVVAIIIIVVAVGIFATPQRVRARIDHAAAVVVVGIW